MAPETIWEAGTWLSAAEGKVPVQSAQEIVTTAKLWKSTDCHLHLPGIFSGLSLSKVSQSGSNSFLETHNSPQAEVNLHVAQPQHSPHTPAVFSVFLPLYRATEQVSPKKKPLLSPMSGQRSDTGQRLSRRGGAKIKAKAWAKERTVAGAAV